jgi:hypothetical protein
MPESQPEPGRRKLSRRWLFVVGVCLAGGIAYLLFAPLGLIWFLRTGGWDKWSKVLHGDVAADGSVLYPVKLTWDFVDLIVAPKPSLKSTPADVRIQVLNPTRQSLSVRCGRRNRDNTGVEADTLIHKITTDVTIDVYEGSLTELHSNWIPIHVQRADGGNSLNVKLRIVGKSNTQETIPFVVEAKWWSYGL